MAPITIRGNTVDPDTVDGAESVHKSKDAANTNYVYIQGHAAFTDVQKAQLEGLGVIFQRYEGEETYLCRYEPSSLERLRSSSFVRHANVYHKVFKSSSGLESILETEQTALVTIGLHKGASNPRDTAKSLADIPGVIVKTATDDRHLVAEVDSTSLTHLEKLDDIILGLDQAREVRCHGTNAFSGRNQVITVADTGLDKGDADDIHPAFSGCNVTLVPVRRDKQTNDSDGHGTHVAASVLGCKCPSSRVSSPGSSAATATAPLAASLMMQSLLNSGLAFEPPQNGAISSLLFEPALKDYGSKIHTNSWGSAWSPLRGQLPYDGSSSAIDDFIFQNPGFVVLFAAGNANGQRISSGEPAAARIGSEAAAKNCITVGASESSRKNNGHSYEPSRSAENDTLAMMRLSSIGPTVEGRIKPDVVAPGSAILSARSRDIGLPKTAFQQYGSAPDGLWAYSTGSSMATPLVAGCVAIIREALLETSARPDDRGPSAALIKALLIHYTIDMRGSHRMAVRDGTQPVQYDAMPSPLYGYGRVNVDAVLNAVVRGESQTGSDALQGFSDTQEPLLVLKQCCIVVNKPDAMEGAPMGRTFKATLVYSDRSGRMIQNYLSLHVKRVDTGETKSGRKSDEPENNVAQFVWEGFPGSSPMIVVNAERVSTAGEAQPFAVVWSWS